MDETYMKRALALAKQGEGFVSPNPLVGAVVVKNGEIIGEGYHERFGGRHAEANAIADAEQRGYSVAGATMYVTLEPCVHFGKTPPCADLIIAKRIGEVVIANRDLNSNAAGGIEKLCAAGIAVRQGILAEKGMELNRFFFHFLKTGLPLFIVKCAVSQNDMVAEACGVRSRITGAEGERFTHSLRRQCDAILIGKTTAIVDDPLLSVRHGTNRRDPLRIVIDPRFEVPTRSKVFRDRQYLVIADRRHQPSARTHAEKNVLYVPSQPDGTLDPKSIAEKLGSRQIISVLVEGGPNTVKRFLDAGLVDTFIVIRSTNRRFDNGILLPRYYELPAWRKISDKGYGSDRVLIYRIADRGL